MQGWGQLQLSITITITITGDFFFQLQLRLQFSCSFNFNYNYNYDYFCIFFSITITITIFVFNYNYNYNYMMHPWMSELIRKFGFKCFIFITVTSYSFYIQFDTCLIQWYSELGHEMLITASQHCVNFWTNKATGKVIGDYGTWPNKTKRMKHVIIYPFASQCGTMWIF